MTYHKIISFQHGKNSDKCLDKRFSVYSSSIHVFVMTHCYDNLSGMASYFAETPKNIWYKKSYGQRNIFLHVSGEIYLNGKLTSLKKLLFWRRKPRGSSQIPQNSSTSEEENA